MRREKLHQLGGGRGGDASMGEEAASISVLKHVVACPFCVVEKKKHAVHDRIKCICLIHITYRLHPQSMEILWNAVDFVIRFF